MQQMAAAGAVRGLLRKGPDVDCSADRQTEPKQDTKPFDIG